MKKFGVAAPPARMAGEFSLINLNAQLGVSSPSSLTVDDPV